MLTQVKKTVLVPSGHSKPVGAYSPGISVSPSRLNSLVFVTGQVATDKDGNVLCPNDPGGQTRVVFERIAGVLAEAGGGLADLVSLTIYVPDLAHFPEISKMRDEMVPIPAPSSTLVEVAGLVEKGCLVEISGIAVL